MFNQREDLRSVRHGRHFTLADTEGSLLTTDLPVRANRTLHWDHAIDRALVHRDSIAEVLLTDLIRLDNTQLLVGAQWPRSHRVYRPDQYGRHDPMLILESVRQTGLAVSHFGFGVGFDQQSVMRDVSFILDPRIEPRGLLSATNLAITVECRDVIMRADRLRGMTVELSFASDGQPFATGRGTVRWMSAQSYAGLRARSDSRLDWGELRCSGTIPPRRPSAIRAAEDVLLHPDTGSGNRRRLVVPLNHPVYFDHPLDHIPGMLIMDAAWQAVAEQRGDGARLIGCMLDCSAFTELGLETDIVLRPISGDTTEFVVEQQGRFTASGFVRVAPDRCRQRRRRARTPAGAAST
jgi:2-oxo-3-(phosphooxy)propyl 3-oxoalkanoate synthase